MKGMTRLEREEKEELLLYALESRAELQSMLQQQAENLLWWETRLRPKLELLQSDLEELRAFGAEVVERMRKDWEKHSARWKKSRRGREVYSAIEDFERSVCGLEPILHPAQAGELVHLDLEAVDQLR